MQTTNQPAPSAQPRRFPAYVLYKLPIQTETLSIVQYLHHEAPHLRQRPFACVERNHPDWIANAMSLPAIEVLDDPHLYNAGTRMRTRYSGLQECVDFFETYSGVSNLTRRASDFKRDNPFYRINS